MTKLLALIPLALVLATPLVFADDTPLVNQELTELAKQANCTDAASPWRVWCVATKWDTGVAAPLPHDTHLVGFSVMMASGHDANAVSKFVTLAALTVGKDDQVKLTDIKPTNKDEEQQTTEAIVNLALVMKGKATKAKLPGPIADYIRSRAPAYKAEKRGGDWVWQGESAGRLRKVGPYWVAIEVLAKEQAVWITILTDAWE